MSSSINLAVSILRDQRTRRGLIATLVSGCLTISVSGIASAQPSSYPAKPITLVVPFPAGGPTDASARLFAKAMSESLGQTMVIENRAGAAGTVGSGYVARMPADGYTLLWGGTSTLAVAPGLYKDLKYSSTSFTPIGMALRGPMMLAGSAALPMKDLSQLLAAARTRPISVGTAGSGSLGHLAVELLRESTGTRLTHIPYRGGSPAITDAIGGQIDLVLDTASALTPFVKNGQLRAFAVSGAVPFKPLPDVPLFSSLVKAYEVYSWFGPVVPSGTPDFAVKKLVEAMAVAAATPAIQKELLLAGVEPGVATPELFADVIRQDADRWAKIITRAGVKAGD